MSEEQKPQSTIVVCQRHGLRYDSAVQDGCVRCRREAGLPMRAAGQSQGGAGATSGGGPKGAARGGGDASLPMAMVVTLVIIATTTFTLYSTHSMIAGMFGAFSQGLAEYEDGVGTGYYYQDGEDGEDYYYEDEEYSYDDDEDDDYYYD